MAPKRYSLENNTQKYEQVTYFGSTVELIPGESFPRKRRRQLLIIAVVAVLAIALIVGLAVGLTKKDKDDDKKTGDTEGFKEASTTTKPVLDDWLNQPCFDPSTAPKCPWKGVNPVILISFSGLDVSYLHKHSFPLIDRLRQCGVHAPYMRPVYPTTAIVNQYALVTGLYPVYSGVIDNRMYDPVLNRTFEESDEHKNPAWWGGEPLWVTVKKHGKRSASSTWVANSVNISGVEQDHVQASDHSVTFEEQVDTVLDWLKLDESSRPDFITVYFGEPDYQGHDFGPEVTANLNKTINALHQLMNGLYRNGLDQCVNVIITSDPGKSETTCERKVVLDYYLPEVDKMLVYTGTRGVIQGNYSRVTETVVVKNDNGLTAQEIIDSLECKNVHLDMFSDATMPVRLHYSHPRIGPVMMRVDDRWIVKQTKATTCKSGDNGYDNIYESMQAVFFAYGPAFKQNFKAEPFDSIELYNIMAGLLEVEPARNNGTAGSLSYILKDMPELPDLKLTFDPTVCGVTTVNRNSSCSCGIKVQPKLSDNSNNKAFPFGVPAIECNTSMCRMNSNQFTVFYDRLNKQPALTSFTLTAEQVQQYNSTTGTCMYPDPRLSDEDDPDCTMYEHGATSIVHTHLFDPGFSTTSEEDAMEAHLSSNMVPMYTGFKDGIWHYLWRVIKEYVTAYQKLHVSVGPVFDRNFDGRADEPDAEQMYVKSGSSVPLPSHYFAILMKCAQTVEDLSQCQAADLQTLAFVLPHINKTTNCMPNRDYLKDNVVRIRDIEVLTGLRFLTTFERHVGARKRTVLKTELWPSPLLTPWVDLPCPIPDDTQCQPGKNPLLLISLDGFRADYFYRRLTPVIQRLAQCGVHTPYMRSVYPTVTFPNHYTIVTGLYPESHGIIGNNMYDEDIDKIFSLSATTAKDPRWWKGEPIWNTAMKQGLKTATYFWPGSDVNISGMYPDIYKTYDGKAGYTSRVMEVLDWLTMPPEERPDFLTLYFDEPDHAGHNSGPVSDEVGGQLETVDKLINILMTNLYEKGLHNCVNMIILADHGMSDQSCDKMVMLKDFLPDVGNMLVFDRTMANIFPEFKADNRTDAHRQSITNPVENIVANLTCRHSAMKAFTKTTLPRRHHYTNSPRIGDVIVDMKDEWIVMRQYTSWCTGGNHGWDNTFKNMHALFLAHGPAFKTNYTTEPFENIELYNLMTEVLNITPAPNNGTQGSLSHVLRNPKDDPNKSHPTPFSCDQPLEYFTSQCGCQASHIISEHDLRETEDMLVFGVPSYSSSNSLCVLHQAGSTAAFSSTLNSPVWLAALVTDVTSKSLMSNSTCIFRAIRAAHWDSTKCTNVTDEMDMEMTPLIDPGFVVDNETAHLSPLLIPMYRGFKSGIWKVVKDLIKDYTELYGKISVTSGPLYDYNNDGLQDEVTDISRYVYNDTTYPVPVPTHVFVSLAKCRVRGEALPCNGDVDILSFILPHSEEIFNCLSPADYLKDNVARIRDIELMNGLQFMTSYNTSYAARLRTYLPEALWKSTLFKEWKDLPCPQHSECSSDYRPLLLVSLDGFRADYLLRNVTPVIERLSQCGVSAPYMRSVYPTKTFPNHYSIVTGLYPESHGIIDNNMYDLGMKKRFSLGSASSKDPRWWGGEPIWLTAKKQGKKAATYFWPGSDVKIQGEYPDYWRNYNGKIPYYERVRQVLEWMTLPKGERPDFITLYFDEPDLAGHKYGPNGDRISTSLKRVDDIIGLLMDGLVERNLHHCVSLVIIADHGMAEVDCDRLVRLRNYVDYDYLSSNTWVWEGPFGRIANRYIYNRSSENQISPAVNPASTDGIFANLTCASPHLDLFRKSTLPVRHHYSNNDRIDDIIVDPDSDWLFTRSFARTCKGGNHGYDNIEKSMRALFLAYGPAFKRNVTVDPFENIELYNMFTELLNVTAAPNNGTMGSLNHILQNPVSYKDPQLFVNQVNGTLQYANQVDFLNYVQSVQCADLCRNIDAGKITGLYDKVTSMVGHISVITDLPKFKQREPGNSSVTVLQYTDFVIGYDEDVSSTLWIIQKISNATKVKPSPVHCVIPDPRISDDKACSNKTDVQFGSLLLLVESPYQFEHLSTLYSMMKQEFVTAIWMPLQELIQEWSIKYGSLEVISGPVYDHDHDSLQDSAQNVRKNREPSHFYVIINRCLDSSNSRCTEYKTFSTILPHVEEILNCKTFEAFLADNECRIRDIELITGLQFYTELPEEESIRLRTYLPDGLWQ